MEQTELLTHGTHFLPISQALSHFQEAEKCKIYFEEKKIMTTFEFFKLSLHLFQPNYFYEFHTGCR